MNTVRVIRGLALTGLASLGLVAMTPDFAETQFSTGAGPNTANARLNFQVNIPRFLSFRVGPAGAGIEQVVFDVAAANVGDGNAVNRTGGLAVDVALRGNGGAINLTANTTGTSLTDLSSGETIPFTQITTTTATGTITAPALVENGVSAPVAVAPNVGARGTDRTATWSYVYENDTVVGAGQYNGQVQYTATMP